MKNLLLTVCTAALLSGAAYAANNQAQGTQANTNTQNANISNEQLVNSTGCPGQANAPTGGGGKNIADMGQGSMGSGGAVVTCGDNYGSNPGNGNGSANNGTGIAPGQAGAASGGTMMGGPGTGGDNGWNNTNNATQNAASGTQQMNEMAGGLVGKMPPGGR